MMSIGSPRSGGPTATREPDPETQHRADCPFATARLLVCCLYQPTGSGLGIRDGDRLTDGTSPETGDRTPHLSHAGRAHTKTEWTTNVAPPTPALINQVVTINSTTRRRGREEGRPFWSNAARDRTSKSIDRTTQRGWNTRRPNLWRGDRPPLFCTCLDRSGEAIKSARRITIDHGCRCRVIRVTPAALAVTSAASSTLRPRRNFAR